MSPDATKQCKRDTFFLLQRDMRPCLQRIKYIVWVAVLFLLPVAGGGGVDEDGSPDVFTDGLGLVMLVMYSPMGWGLSRL